MMSQWRHLSTYAWNAPRGTACGVCNLYATGKTDNHQANPLSVRRRSRASAHQQPSERWSFPGLASTWLRKGRDESVLAQGIAYEDYLRVAMTDELPYAVPHPDAAGALSGVAAKRINGMIRELQGSPRRTAEKTIAATWSPQVKVSHTMMLERASGCIGQRSTRSC